ncbi:MAG: glycosyltransferase family 4 protein [bacterium]|nr:glycosyltransferase family 4 protein [bacterium]
MKNNFKILYLFSGKRSNVYQGEMHKDYPDTPFYGLNYLSDFGFEAEYKDIYDILKSKKLIQKLPFVWQHILLTKFIKNYNIVFGSSILYNVIFKKIFGLKTKYVLLNISLNNTLFRNKKNKFKYRLIKYLINQLDAIVCLSHFQIDDLVNNYQVDKHKLFFVLLGVDKDFWTEVDFVNNANILVVGKDNGRDYKTLFEVAKKLPNEKFVVVCGRWNIHDLRVPSNVRVIFGLPIKELQILYKSAKMLLLITHNDEHLDGSDCSGQTVLLDAMSSGLPIIVSRKKYLEDYVRDKEELLTVNFYDAGDIVAKIKMLSDQKLAGRLAEAARSKAISCFSSRQMAENLSQIFKQLL